MKKEDNKTKEVANKETKMGNYRKSHVVMKKRNVVILASLASALILAGGATTGYFAYKATHSSTNSGIVISDETKIVDSTIQGKGSVNIQLNEMPKYNEVKVSITNDGDNLFKVELDNKTEGILEVGEDKKINVNVKFASVPYQNCESTYTLTIKYIDSNGKTKTIKTEDLKLNYVYGGMKTESVIDYVPSYESLTGSAMNENEATQAICDYLVKNPNYIKDFVMEKDQNLYYSYDYLNTFVQIWFKTKIVTFDFYEIGMEDIKISKHHDDNKNIDIPLVSFKVKSLMSYGMVYNMFGFDIAAEATYTNVPFTVKYHEVTDNESVFIPGYEPICWKLAPDIGYMDDSSIGFSISYKEITKMTGLAEVTERNNGTATNSSGYEGFTSNLIKYDFYAFALENISHKSE